MSADAGHWMTRPLGELITLHRGFDITKNEQRPGPYPVYSSSGPNSTHDEFKVEGPGVIIGRKGSLGTVFFEEGLFWPHDTTLWVKDFRGSDPKFVYYFLKTMGLERYDAGASNPTQPKPRSLDPGVVASATNADADCERLISIR